MVLLLLVVHFSLLAFLGIDSREVGEQPLWGMAKRVWVFAMLMSVGMGTLLATALCAVLARLSLVNVHMGRGLSATKIGVLLSLAVGIWYGFFYLSQWLDRQIHNHIHEIVVFFRFGYEQVPMPVTMLSDYFIVLVAVGMLIAAIAALALPFKARKTVQWLKDNAAEKDAAQKSNDDEASL